MRDWIMSCINWKLSMRLASFAVLSFWFMADIAWSGTATEAQWQQVKALRGIPSGPPDVMPTTYVFFDPNCVGSASLTKTGVSLPGADLRKAVWIPLAYVRPHSGAKAAALQRNGQFEAIVKNFRNFNRARYEGSIPGVDPSPSELKELERSKAVWMSLTSTPATPMIVYKDKDGIVQIHLGAPSRPKSRSGYQMDTYNE